MGLKLSKRRSIATLLVLVAIVALFRWAPPSGPRPERPWEAKPSPLPPKIKIFKRKLANPLMFAPQKTKEAATLFANSTLYVLMLPSAHIWERVPLLTNTLFSQYPHSLVSSDSGAVIGSTTVHNALALLGSEVLRKDENLEPYLIQQYGNDKAWGFPIHEYPQNNPNYTMPLVRQETLKLAQAQLQPQHKWVILANEHSYLSPHALNDAPPSNTRFTSNEHKTDGSVDDILLLSRDAFEVYVNTNELPHMTIKPAHNISSTMIAKDGWCEPLYAFTGLQRWELQTLYGRDASGTSDPDRILGSAFYRDYIMPFVAEERANLFIDPVGEVYNDVTPEGGELTKIMCRKLCQQNSECLAWQWSERRECRLETRGVKRGIVVNPSYKQVDKSHPLVISGYMVERIRAIRQRASCDPLKDEPDGHYNVNEVSREGYIQRIRDKAMLEESEVLKSLRDYENQAGYPPENDETLLEILDDDDMLA